MTRKALGRTAGSRHYLVAADETVGAAAVVGFQIPLKDALRCRIRAKCSTAGGTFTFRFMRPDANGDYQEDNSQNHADEAAADLVLADTSEGISDNIDIYGEAFLWVEYTDDGDGSTIEYIAFSGVE